MDRANPLTSSGQPGEACMALTSSLTHSYLPSLDPREPSRGGALLAPTLTPASGHAWPGASLPPLIQHTRVQRMGGKRQRLLKNR